MENNTETAKEFLLKTPRHLGDAKFGTQYSNELAELLVKYASQFAPERPSDDEIEKYVMDKYYETSSYPYCQGVIEEIKLFRDRIFNGAKKDGV